MIMKPRTDIECDWCSAAQPAMWVVHHRKFSFLEVELKTKASTVYQIDDGDMATCDVCLPLVDRKDAAALSQRAIELLKPSEGAAAMLTQYHWRVIEHLLPARELRKASEPRIGPKFYEHKCRRCGHRNVVDNESYARHIEFPCGACGVKIALVGHPLTEPAS